VTGCLDLDLDHLDIIIGQNKKKKRIKTKKLNNRKRDKEKKDEIKIEIKKYFIFLKQN